MKKENLFKKIGLFSLYFLIFLITLKGALSQEERVAYDDFECGNFSCGAGWLDDWNYTGDCIVTSLGIPLGVYHLRGQEDGGSCIADRYFNNFDYNTTISFYATATLLEVGDYCRYYYYNGTSYTQLLELTDGDDDGIYDFYNFNVEQYGLSLNAGIRIRQFGTGADNCFLDNVNITGLFIEKELEIKETFQIDFEKTSNIIFLFVMVFAWLGVMTLGFVFKNFGFVSLGFFIGIAIGFMLSGFHIFLTFVFILLNITIFYNFSRQNK